MTAKREGDTALSMPALLVVSTSVNTPHGRFRASLTGQQRDRRGEGGTLDRHKWKNRQFGFSHREPPGLERPIVEKTGFGVCNGGRGNNPGRHTYRFLSVLIPAGQVSSVRATYG
jgi:hypothetical protein